jgi:hypothetical protein
MKFYVLRLVDWLPNAVRLRQVWEAIFNFGYCLVFICFQFCLFFIVFFYKPD